MRHHILIIDDDEAIRDLLAEVLAVEGYPVATATDGLDALRVVAQSIPALVLLDLNMPRLDGAVGASPRCGSPLGQAVGLSALLALVARVVVVRGQLGGSA